LSINAKDTLILWDENYKNEAELAFIQLAADLTIDDYGEYEIMPSPPYEQGRAFASLNQPEQINMMIASVDKLREQQANTIYIPLERGLAGFRLCLVKNTNSQAFLGINTLRDFRKRKLSVGVGAHWPDKAILTFNQLPVTTSPIESDLYSMLDAGRFACLSRSVKEVSESVINQNHIDIGVEQNIAFIYPLADFIYISKTETRLAERIEKGLRLAIENEQFYTLFEKHYKQLLLKHNLYGRKLFFLKNENMSEKARDAINQYGIASFSSQY
jgi:hypothetical protein